MPRRVKNHTINHKTTTTDPRHISAQLSGQFSRVIPGLPGAIATKCHRRGSAAATATIAVNQARAVIEKRGRTLILPMHILVRRHRCGCLPVSSRPHCSCPRTNRSSLNRFCRAPACLRAIDNRCELWTRPQSLAASRAWRGECPNDSVTLERTSSSAGRH